MAVNAFGDQIVEESASAGVNVFGDPVVGGTAPNPQQVKSIGDAILFGLRSSSTGLAVRGKMPEQQLGEDAPWYHRISAAAGGVAGDLPAGVVGAAVLSRAGPMGMMVGGFAAPMGLRAALVEAYTGNHATSWQGAWEIAKAGLTGVAKGAVIGLATAGAGRVVAPFLAPMGKAVEAIGTFGTELAALTTTAAAVEGHLPSWQDFMDNAILLGGMKGAVRTAKGLAGIWGQTGKEPAAVLADAQRDPTIKAAAEKGELPEAYAPLALEQRVKAALDIDSSSLLVDAMMKQAKDPNAKLDSPVKYDYIFDKETADGVVEAISKVYGDVIAKQTRGEVPVRQSIAEAVSAVGDGELSAARGIGSADNSGVLAARALLAKGAAENAQKLAETLPREQSAWSLEQKLQWAGAMEQVSMLYAQYRGAGAEAARSLNMLGQLKRNPDLLANAEALVRLYERDAKQGDFATMAAMVRGFKDPESVRAFAEKLNKPTIWARFIEPWRAGIFSGPLTWGANLYGNVAGWTVSIADSTVAATMTAARQGIKGDPLSVAQYKARALAPLYGAQLAALDGIHLVAEGKRLVEANGWAGVKEGAKAAVDRLSREDDRLDIYRRANTPGLDNIAESAAGYLASASFGMLKAQDLPFRTVGERAEAYKLAVDRAAEDGWHPSTREWTEAVTKYVQDPTVGLSAKDAAKIESRIEQAGAKAVFSERLGPVTERISSAISGTPWELLLPARRTPANLLSWAVQHSPGLNLMSGRWREDFAAGGERRDMALARVVTGTALAATAYGLASNGMLTGGGLTEKEMGLTKAGANEQPYSLKVGNSYYSVQRIEPVAKIFMLTGDIHEILNSSKISPEDKEKAASLMALAFANATISTTYLSGLSNFFRAALDPERYGNQFVESYATSLIPKFIGQPVMMADPYKREVDGALEAIQSQLPYFREQLLAKRDAWGEPSQNNRWFGVMPVAVSQASQDKVKTEAVRLMIGIADAPKYIEERGPFSAREKRTALSTEQRDVIRQVSGTTAMTVLRPIVSAPDWERIPDFAKAAIYKAVLEGTRKQGAFAALPPDDAARMTLREKIVEKIIKQTQEAEGTAAPAPERRVK